jgi:methylmalonyl-CoA mutase N-terminal domain/subunit
MERSSESGLPIAPVYDDSKLTDFQPRTKLGLPGECPFTRGAYPPRYLDRPWTTLQPRRAGPAIEAEQAARRPHRRAWAEFSPRISTSKKAAETADNVIYPLPDVIRDGATLGEVCDAQREV